MDVSVEETGGRKERKLSQLHVCLYRQIFFNVASGSDFMIISNEGRAFPCHTAILSEECEVLSNMLKKNWIEVTTTRLVLQDLSAEGVEALLRYMYLKDTEKPRKQFSNAVELYKTSHKFMLHDLSAEIKEIIMGKQTLEWYSSDIESCIELYRFTSITKEEAIKARLLRVLKSIDNIIENRWKIRDECRNDPHFAVTLFWDSFRLCTCSVERSDNRFASENSESEPEDTDELTNYC